METLLEWAQAGKPLRTVRESDVHFVAYVPEAKEDHQLIVRVKDKVWRRRADGKHCETCDPYGFYEAILKDDGRKLYLNFNNGLANKILKKTKTVTRRIAGLECVNTDENPNRFIVTDTPCDSDGCFVFTSESGIPTQHRVRCPWGDVGDLLMLGRDGMQLHNNIKIKRIKIDRLDNMQHADAWLEGFKWRKQFFKVFWDIYSEDPRIGITNDNPWVWVITFEVV